MSIISILGESGQRQCEVTVGDFGNNMLLERRTVGDFEKNFADAKNTRKRGIY